MRDDTVVAFPGRDYQTWLRWVECELSILGHDIAKLPDDWRAAFDRGLRPEQAAEQAVGQVRKSGAAG